MSKTARIFPVIFEAFSGYKVAINLSTAIRTKLKMDTAYESTGEFIPILQNIGAIRESLIRLPPGFNGF